MQPASCEDDELVQLEGGFALTFEDQMGVRNHALEMGDIVGRIVMTAMRASFGFDSLEQVALSSIH